MSARARSARVLHGARVVEWRSRVGGPRVRHLLPDAPRPRALKMPRAHGQGQTSQDNHPSGARRCGRRQCARCARSTSRLRAHTNRARSERAHTGWKSIRDSPAQRDRKTSQRPTGGLQGAGGAGAIASAGEEGARARSARGAAPRRWADARAVVQTSTQAAMWARGGAAHRRLPIVPPRQKTVLTDGRARHGLEASCDSGQHSFLTI